eukprot:scaffold27981_cov37-Cyclotella_meneghiniana.AAC.9
MFQKYADNEIERSIHPKLHGASDLLPDISNDDESKKRKGNSSASPKSSKTTKTTNQDCSLRGNLLMCPSYSINPNYNSNNASQGCGL